jgi:hypothetical protein
MRRLALVLLLAALPAAAAPADLSSIAGVYKNHFANSTVDGGPYTSEDILEIVPRSRATAYVRLHLEFYNGHLCALEAIAERRADALVYDLHRNDDGSHCVLSLQATADKLVLHDPGGACRQYYCGARGSLDGASFDRAARRPIRYMKRLLASREYAAAVAEYDAAHRRR